MPYVEWFVILEQKNYIAVGQRLSNNKPAMQAARRPLTDAIPTTGQIHPFSKMAKTLDPAMLFVLPL